jgi:type II secretion system protein G
LVLLATPPALGYETRYGNTEANLMAVRTALDTFAIDCGRYPTTAEGMQALHYRPVGISTNQWHGPYVDQPTQDAWRHDFIYLCPGLHNANTFDLYSLGRDGLSKTGGDDSDDINNWDSARQWARHYSTDSQMRQLLPPLAIIGGGACAAITSWLLWRNRRASKKPVTSQ